MNQFLGKRLAASLLGRSVGRSVACWLKSRSKERDREKKIVEAVEASLL